MGGKGEWRESFNSDYLVIVHNLVVLIQAYINPSTHIHTACIIIQVYMNTYAHI